MNIDEIAKDIFNAVKENKLLDTEKEKRQKLNEIKEIIEPYLKLFEEAREKKRYFYLRLSDTWFSPDNLEQEMKKGFYVFTVDNWELRDPMERVHQIEDELFRKAIESVKFKEEVYEFRYGHKR